MIERLVTIQNKKGLHARAAAKFVKTSSAMNADVTVIRLNSDDEITEHADWQVSSTSILGLMMLGAEPGSRLMLRAEGEQAQDVIDALEKLVNDLFDEGE